MCIPEALISGVKHSIPDNALSASSVYYDRELAQPYQSRFSSAYGWTADFGDTDKWIQVSNYEPNCSGFSVTFD